MSISATSSGPGHGLLVPTTNSVVSTKPSPNLPKPKDSVDSKADEKDDDARVQDKGLSDVIEEEKDHKQFQKVTGVLEGSPSLPLLGTHINLLA
jgi:hypothetical protein